MELPGPRRHTTARERLLDAAYHLFSTQGIGRVGIDMIVARSGCAKSSLYNHFSSKEALAIAFLKQREERWTREWLEANVRRHAVEPEERLLGIFDIFDDWFHDEAFEGCSFINVLLEAEAESPVRRAAAGHLRRIRGIVRELAEDAGLADTEAFAQAWHMLMKGSIVSAAEGNRKAARHARQAARLVLANWARKSPAPPP